MSHEAREPSAKYLVKAAYKQTEVGVIPEDWNVALLTNLADKIMVGIASAATRAYRDRGAVLFRNQNIKPCHFDDTDILYIDDDYEYDVQARTMRGRVHPVATSRPKGRNKGKQKRKTRKGYASAGLR